LVFSGDYLNDFASIAKPVTDLTKKRVPHPFPWCTVEKQAFDRLKHLLIESTMKALHIMDCSKPFTILVDACDYAVRAMLVQPVR
jgi:hypothetical protein